MSIEKKQENPREIYGDIIDLPRPVSRKHPPMNRLDRAAQFAPFAALAGYEDMISEEARITDEMIEPGEDQLEMINETLRLVDGMTARRETPVCEVTWFVPDPFKRGGAYRTAKERVKRVDRVRGLLVLTRTQGYGKSNAAIELGKILEIKIEGNGNS